MPPKFPPNSPQFPPLPEADHPFKQLHEKPVAELFDMLSTEVREYVDWCPASEFTTDVRKKFTLAIVFWSEWYEDQYERKAKDKAKGEKKDEKKDETSRKSPWYDKCERMDNWIARKRVRVALSSYPSEEAPTTEEEAPIAEA